MTSPSDLPTDIQGLLITLARSGPAGQFLAGMLLLTLGTLFVARVVVWLVSVHAWHKHRQDRKLDSKAPPPPPAPRGLTVWALILSASLAAGTALSVGTVLATYYCPARCPPGEECVGDGSGRRFCGKQARPGDREPPMPPADQRPESATLLRETPAIDRVHPFNF